MPLLDDDDILSLFEEYESLLDRLGKIVAKYPDDDEIRRTYREGAQIQLEYGDKILAMEIESEDE